MAKASSVEDFKQITNFQSLRTALLQENSAERLEKPLAYWALPSDRRLPLAFLGRTLRELLETPYEQLSDTAGIGRKKLGSMLKLLARAAKQPMPNNSTIAASLLDESKLTSERPPSQTDFDPSTVSEALWEQWRETVRVHGVGNEMMGRLAPSLQALPTVIWRSPLSSYLEYSVAEMRQLKTHGEKRIRVILEVFYVVHEALANLRIESHLTLRLLPKFVAPLEQWIADSMRSPDSITTDSVRQLLAVPLLNQVHIDCGPTIAHLAEGRLGIYAAPNSVKTQSKRMGVTRARIYQLLEECEQAIDVRWPQGRCLLLFLSQKMEQLPRRPEGLPMLCSIIDLFFPDPAETARRQADKTEATEQD